MLRVRCRWRSIVCAPLTRGCRSEALFFDEHVTQKLNQSRMRLFKDDTPFLADDSHRILRTVDAPGPIAAPATRTPRAGIPEQFDLRLTHGYRPAQPLVSEQSVDQLRRHTYAQARRARMLQRQGKVRCVHGLPTARRAARAPLTRCTAAFAAKPATREHPVGLSAHFARKVRLARHAGGVRVEPVAHVAGPH